MNDAKTFSSDTPISDPNDDQFDVNPFARTLADSIAAMKAPNGTVIAINGPWGSGKSSVINLILHHLEKNRDVTVVNFRPWWFAGVESLTVAFFSELKSALGSTLSNKSKEALDWIGKRLSMTNPLISAAVNLQTAGVGGEVVGAGIDILSNLLNNDKSMDERHKELSVDLSQQKRRFLVVIDDIDRLLPDEALAVFRLVKSVGHLPNVIYLLSFDRVLAERLVSEKFPSEGPHYLEKIVQASFELPIPEPSDLRNSLLIEFYSICGKPEEHESTRFMNLFFDVVAPYLQTPRDLKRLINTLRVTWPAVSNEVDRADFLSIEALRLFDPHVYRAVRANPEAICGLQERNSYHSSDSISKQYDELLLTSIDDKRKNETRARLMRLFPRLQRIWGNMGFTNEFLAEWRQQRLVCSAEHFRTYFRFSLSDEILPASKFNALVDNAGDSEYVKRFLRDSLAQRRRNGQTQGSVVLEELNVRSSAIRDADIPSLVNVLFELGDELNVIEDERQGFGIANNQLRLYWLLNRVVRERFDLDRRSELLTDACQRASLGWLVYFASRCQGERTSRADRQPLSPEERLVTDIDCSRLCSLALERIRHSAKDGTLLANRRVLYILYRWNELAGVGLTSEVKDWVTLQLHEISGAIRIAEILTSVAWSHSEGDRVIKSFIRIQKDGLSDIVNVNRFLERMREVAKYAWTLPAAQRQIVERFWQGWNNRD